MKELEKLKEEHNALETKMIDSERISQKYIVKLESEKSAVDVHIGQLQDKINDAQLTLTLAAVRDVRWIELVRTQLMPKQPSRVPFHNDAEVAIRGYHCGNIKGTLTLNEITWSILPYNENGLQRGYYAGLIFKGSNFAPGVTWAYRE